MIHVYKNNPTAGGVDGSLVSEGTGLNAITNPTALSVIAGEESAGIKLAIRTDAGYKTSGNTTMAPVGTSKDNWALSTNGTDWLAWGATMTITAEITAVNTIVWVKCKSVTGEPVINDTTVDLQIVGNVVAV